MINIKSESIANINRWHILTCIGVYMYMVLAEFLQPAYWTSVLKPGQGFIALMKGPGILKKSDTVEKKRR